MSGLERCRHCGGTGSVIHSQTRSSDGIHMDEGVGRCPACAGSGFRSASVEAVGPTSTEDDVEPENDAPMNLCRSCGMRTTAPGLTACSDCA